MTSIISARLLEVRRAPRRSLPCRPFEEVSEARPQQSLTILSLVARRLFRLANSPKAAARVAAVTGNVHTPTMTLKNAALLATDRNSSDDGSFGVEFRLQLAQSAAWIGSCGHALLVVQAEDEIS